MEASGTEVAACGAGQRKSEKRSAGKDGFGRGYFRGSSPYLSGSRACYFYEGKYDEAMALFNSTDLDLLNN